VKYIKPLAFAVALIMLLTISACSGKQTAGEPKASLSPSAGQIYLVGEQHGVKKILDKEFELWSGCYNGKNMRHLFVELPYYAAEFMNLWMKSGSDDILDALYADSAGTDGNTPDTKAIYQKIKSDLPETVFHGTDVGHQFDSTGARYMMYLEEHKLKGSGQYKLAQEAIEQGKKYYENRDNIYRENTMAENFIREFDGLNGADIMGIYGSAHTGLDAMDFTTKSVPCMANQLKARYGGAVHSADLSSMALDIEPIRTDKITVGGKEYEASYFGVQDLTGFKDFTNREFWRIENAYDDFKNNPKTGDKLPDSNYPMLIETGQAFAIKYTKTDGSVYTAYYRSDGYTANGAAWTEEFTVS
jgi:hypothetical protein